MPVVNVTAKSRTLANGTANDAGPVEANFLELYNNDAALATGLNLIIGTSGGASVVDGRNLLMRNSFSGTPASTDHIAFQAQRGGAGIREIRWNETNDNWEATDDGTNYYLLRGGLPYSYLAGKAPRYNNASSIILPLGLAAKDSTNTADIITTSDLTVSLAASGENGLDTGAEAANTWYYVYLIRNDSTGTVAGLLSTTNEAVSGSVTMPAGYTQKRQLPVALRNNASSNLIPFIIGSGWPNRPLIQWQADTTVVNSGFTFVAGSLNVLAAGTATSYTSVSLTSLVPPASGLVDLLCIHNGLAFPKLRTDATLANVRQISGSVSGTYNMVNVNNFPVTSSQAIEYLTTSGSLYIDVLGFVITGI